MHTHVHCTVGKGELVSGPKLIAEKGRGIDHGVPGLDSSLGCVAADALKTDRCKERLT
jgi:hypothetical protein